MANSVKNAELTSAYTKFLNVTPPSLTPTYQGWKWSSRETSILVGLKCEETKGGFKCTTATIKKEKEKEKEKEASGIFSPAPILLSTPPTPEEEVQMYIRANDKRILWGLSSADERSSGWLGPKAITTALVEAGCPHPDVILRLAKEAVAAAKTNSHVSVVRMGKCDYSSFINTQKYCAIKFDNKRHATLEKPAEKLPSSKSLRDNIQEAFASYDLSKSKKL